MIIKSEFTAGPPTTIPMRDMHVGDIGQVASGSFSGETVFRGHAGWFCIENDRFWGREYARERAYVLDHPVRILQRGESITLTAA